MNFTVARAEWPVPCRAASAPTCFPVSRLEGSGASSTEVEHTRSVKDAGAAVGVCRPLMLERRDGVMPVRGLVEGHVGKKARGRTGDCRGDCSSSFRRAQVVGRARGAERQLVAATPRFEDLPAAHRPRQAFVRGRWRIAAGSRPHARPSGTGAAAQVARTQASTSPPAACASSSSHVQRRRSGEAAVASRLRWRRRADRAAARAGARPGRGPRGHSRLTPPSRSFGGRTCTPRTSSPVRSPPR